MHIKSVSFTFQIVRGQVLIPSPDGNIQSYSNTRLSNGYFIEYSIYREHPFLEKIDLRVQDMTNLVQKSFEPYTEPLQTSNYGLGGYYDVHNDCSDRVRTFVAVWKINITGWPF